MESGVPKHLGLILDGNRRWARARGYSVKKGHREGYLNLKSVTKAAISHGVRYVSAFVFSSENWRRDKQEVKDIMNILAWVLKHEVKEFHQENIRVRVIGSKDRLGASILKSIREAEELTKNNTRGTLIVCLDYGGQQEIAEALKKMIKAGVKPQQVTTESISRYLYAPDVPPLDLIIRTSGEQRISNFLLWESAYSELIFNKKFWPEYSEQDLLKDLRKFSRLNRRFGE